jgi:flagellar biosynthesis/type III secretory pathway M-ring protein FliF/YscJ
MRSFLNDVLLQLKGIWSRLDGGQRLIVSAVLAATVVGLGAIVWYAGRPSYEAVFTANTRDESSQMQQALGQAGVGYTMTDDGLTFLVERSKVGLANQAKLKAGLTSRADPVVGGASSLMDDSETKAWKLAMAASAQAENAIMGLDGVAWVKVTASKPRRTSAFRDRDAEQKPSATVAMRLRPGSSFHDIARSAAGLVSSQLGIPLQNVEVVSSTGSMRYRFDPDRDSGGGSSEFIALQRSLGAEKARQAQERLDTMWPGKTSVAVTVELETQWEITNQRVVPNDPLVSSEKMVKDSTVNKPGKGNENGSPAEAGPTNEKKNETKDRTFVTDIGERRSGRLAPDIKRMTVAVLYDRSLEKVEGFTPEALGKAVKSIVGWDKRRDQEEDFTTLVGDIQPFEYATETSSGPGLADVALRWGPTVGQILGVIVVVMFLRGLFRRTTVGTTSTSSARLEPREDKQNPDDQHKRMRREIERRSRAIPPRWRSCWSPG